MNKFIFKITILALTFGILPTGALQAMNAPTQSTEIALYANNNQDMIQDITEDIKTKSKRLLAFAVVAPLVNVSALAVHEGGHALMASIIQPGCVQKITVGWTRGFCDIPDMHFMRPQEQIAICAAGPIAGALFSYGCAKGLKALNTHLKKQDLITNALNMQLPRTSNASIIIGALGNAADIAVKWNIMNLNPAMDESDGSWLLKAALFEKHDMFFGKPLPLPITIPAMYALMASTELYDKSPHSYGQYEIAQSKEDTEQYMKHRSLVPPAYGKISKTLERLLL